MKKWRSPHDEASQEMHKQRALVMAIVLCCLAFAVQLAGSFYTGSIALLGDTVHLFTDLFSLFMSLFAVILGRRPTTSLRSYGLYRLEVLASFLNALLLVGVSVGLAWESVERLQSPKAVLALPLLVVAASGLLLNLASAAAIFRAMAGDHSHNHGHQHHHEHTHEVHEDRNLRSALVHVLSDALGSVAVIAGAIVIHFTGLNQVDAWIGLALAALIAYWAVRLLVDTTHVLLESTPKHVEPEKLLSGICALDPRILEIEDVHVWEITSRMYAASGEITVPKETSLPEADALREKILAWLEEQYGIAHAVIVMKAAP